MGIVFPWNAIRTHSKSTTRPENETILAKGKSVDELERETESGRSELIRVNCLTRGSVGEICMKLGAATRQLLSLEFPGKPGKRVEVSRVLAERVANVSLRAARRT